MRGGRKLRSAWRYLKLEASKKEVLSDAEDPARASQRLWRRSLLSVGIVLLLVAIMGLIHPGDDMLESYIPEGIPDGAQLRMVAALNRHGDRTAIRHYRFEEFEWTWALGKLTPEGMVQAFEYGQGLRKKYGSLVAASLARYAAEGTFESSLQIQSTNVDRTVDTAHCLVLGLLSPDGTKTKITGATKAACHACRPNEGERAPADCLAQCMGLAKLPEQLPELQVNPKGTDILLEQAYVCDGYLRWLTKFENSPEWLQARDEHEDAVDVLLELTKKFGDHQICLVPTKDQTEPECCEFTKEDELDLIKRVYDDVVCAEAHGFRLNHLYTNEELLDTLFPAADWLWHETFASKQGPDVAGILLNDILQGMRESALHYASTSVTEHHGHSAEGLSTDDAALAEDAPPQIRLFSAHDTTVYSLLAALGATEGAELPHYTAHITLELWQLAGRAPAEADDPLDKFKVVVRYNGKPVPIAAEGVASGLHVVFPDGICSLSECLDKLASRLRTEDDCTLFDGPNHSPKCHYTLDYLSGEDD